jgi:class 3 adenylate cyclase
MDAVLDGQSYPDDPADRSQSALTEAPGEGAAFVILAIDIANSSRWVNEASQQQATRLLQVFAYEVGLLVALFHGHVLRYEGDGAVAYFPEPGFISKNDLALDCGLCLQRLLGRGVNPELVKRGLAPIQARIGIEAGEASVVLLGAAASKRHADLVGNVLAVAANVRKQAEPSEVLVGGVCERNSHVAWREQCEPVTPSADWPYHTGGQPYQLFRLKSDAQRPVEQGSITPYAAAD